MGVDPNSWPTPDTPCRGRGCRGSSSTPKPRRNFPKIPTCPEETATAEVPCTSNEGKFYDKLTRKFVVPTVSGTGDLYVCEPRLWSACQYLALCREDSNDVAIFKIIDVDNKIIRVQNACSSGDEIIGNPDPGTSLDIGTVLYPVPPPWCSNEFNDRLIEALTHGGCAGVLACLGDSDEVCLTNVSDLVDADGEVHLFGGIMESWKSCLRKLKRIFTSGGGTTLCFPDVADTSDDPEVVDSVDVPKHYVYFDKNRCLKRGGEVGVQHCGEDLNVPEDDRMFDAIRVCKDGIEMLFPPLAEGETLVARKNDSNVLKWMIGQGGLSYHPHAIVDVYSSTSTGTITLPDFPTVPTGGKIFAHFTIKPAVAFSTNGSNGLLDIAIDGKTAYRVTFRESADNCMMTNIMIECTDNTPSIAIAFISVIGTCNLASLKVKLEGYTY